MISSLFRQDFDKRRTLLRQRMQKKEAETDLLDLEEEPKSDQDEEEEVESSEYEEYSDSEEEFGARLKPVFVRKWVFREHFEK